jgi:thioredoxin 1
LDCDTLPQWQYELMPAETAYRDETQAPTREEVDRSKGPVLLEFGTSWCGHCRAIALRVTELLDRHPEVKHVKVEDGPGRPLGRSFQVRLWPSFVFLRDGRVVRQLARPSHAALDEAFQALEAG